LDHPGHAELYLVAVPPGSLHEFVTDLAETIAAVEGQRFRGSGA
jgi:hypothetical protein